MNKFKLFQVLKVVWSAVTKEGIRAIIISDKIENKAVIKFKNGSYIKVLTSRESARGNRAKLYPRPTEDFMPEEYIDEKILDEVLAPFCKKRKNNDIDGQILYVSSTRNDIRS